MYLSLRRLAAILGVLMLCSCSTSAPRPISTEVANSSMELVQPSLTPRPNTLTLTLQCTTYIETAWGAGPGEFGLCPASSEQMGRPYPPVLDARGNLFILDRVNQRILKYSGSTMPQVISVPSSYVLRDPCSYATRGLSNLSVYADRLFLLFPAYRDGRLVEHLAVMSPSDQEEQIISLEAYYPRYSRSAPIADGEGGAYILLPPEDVVYFDARFRPELMFLGIDEVGIKGLVVGWNGNLYTYSAGRDDLTDWGTGNDYFRHSEPVSRRTGVISATQIASATWKRLIGVDAQGRFYFKIGVDEQGIGYRFVRISASGDEMAVATVPDGVLDSVLPSFSLAPDGSLYGMSYGLAEPDPSVKPRIIKCAFDTD